MEATLAQSDIPFFFSNCWTLNTTVLDPTPPSLEKAKNEAGISYTCARQYAIPLLSMENVPEPTSCIYNCPFGFSSVRQLVKVSFNLGVACKTWSCQCLM